MTLDERAKAARVQQGETACLLWAPDGNWYVWRRYPRPQDGPPVRMRP